MELCSRLSTSKIIVHRAEVVLEDDGAAVVVAHEEDHRITTPSHSEVTHSITEQSIDEAYHSIDEEMEYEYEEVLEDSYTSATIILETPKEASIAELSLNKTELNGYQVSAALKHHGDVGITIKLPKNDVHVTVENVSEAVKRALDEVTLVPKSISIKTNLMATIGFLNKEQVSGSSSSCSRSGTDTHHLHHMTDTHHHHHMHLSTYNSHDDSLAKPMTALCSVTSRSHPLLRVPPILLLPSHQQHQVT